MTVVLRSLGYWDGPEARDGLPDVCGFVRADADADEQRAVVAYLRSGTVFVAAAGVSHCRLCGAANGNTEQTDGKHFIWPEGLTHYVLKHNVRLPREVATIAGRGTAAAVDLRWFTRALAHTGEVFIDRTWWQGQSGAVTEHLFGCRWHDSVAAWNLPARADIHVDRIPPDGVETLIRLRELLGTTWPDSALPELLARQPFLAVAAGNPAKLHRVLADHIECWPHLFYTTTTGLRPVRSGR